MKRIFQSLIPLILALAWAASAQEDAVLTVHVVQSGENLFRIALKYDLFAVDVAKANGISENDAISVGQRLIIPLIQAAPAPKLTHRVSPGEEPASIAAAYGLSLDELLRINGLSSAADISAMQELIIVPGASDATPEPEPVTEDPGPAASAGGDSLIIGDPDFEFAHIVQAGDTVSELALRYNMTTAELAAANSLANASMISVGQRLVIPGVVPPRLDSPLPQQVRAFSLDPLIPEVGRSFRIEVHTREPAQLQGLFLDQALRVVARDGGKRHTMLVGIPMFTAQDIYPLRLSIGTGQDAAAISAKLQVIGGGYGYQSININDSALLAADLEDAEIERLSRLTSPFSAPRRWRDTLSLPSAAKMNAIFGILRSYNGGAYDRYHQGVDFAGATGSSVLAAAAGQVVLAESLRIRGLTIVIDHGWGLYSAYAHLNSMHVAAGEAIAAGQIIGAIGSTGRSTGPHLHWEVWLNGVNVDPMQWVTQSFS